MSDSEVDYFTDKAIKWVATLDRERLGRFANSEEEFIAFSAWKMHSVARRENGGTRRSMLDDVTLGKRYSLDNEQKVWHEYRFWTTRHQEDFNDDVVDSYFRTMMQNQQDYNLTYGFYRVHQYPEYHDYFAVGIWDIEFIKRCIVDGIDANIALGLVR